MLRNEVAVAGNTEVFIVNLSPRNEDMKSTPKKAPKAVNANKQEREFFKLDYVDAMLDSPRREILTRSKRKAASGTPQKSSAKEIVRESKIPRYEFDCDDEAYVSSDEEVKDCENRRDIKKTYTPYEGCGGVDICELCQNGSPAYLQGSECPGWRETVFAVFDFYPREKPESLKDDWIFFPEACKFVEGHWDLICPPQHRGKILDPFKWRKIIQDTLSHNRGHFISGKQTFGEKGFWRLARSRKTTINEYAINEEKSSGPEAEVSTPHLNIKYGGETALSVLADVAEMARTNPDFL